MKTIYKKQYRLLIQQLQQARLDNNLTQQQVADKLERPQSYIAKIEGYERKLDVLEFVELCMILELDPSETIKVIS